MVVIVVVTSENRYRWCQRRIKIYIYIVVVWFHVRSVVGHLTCGSSLTCCLASKSICSHRGSSDPAISSKTALIFRRPCWSCAGLVVLAACRRRRPLLHNPVRDWSVGCLCCLFWRWIFLACLVAAILYSLTSRVFRLCTTYSFSTGLTYTGSLVPPGKL